jgi:hypothetical protein
MGIALWIASGLLAFGLTRLLPFGRNRRRVPELAAAVLAALVFGLVATALDFGGWNELEWRAALFAFLGAFAATGVVRGITMRS